jgi:hypothetical protein
MNAISNAVMAMARSRAANKEKNMQNGRHGHE